jgi:hypothetical protein
MYYCSFVPLLCGGSKKPKKPKKPKSQKLRRKILAFSTPGYSTKATVNLRAFSFGFLDQSISDPDKKSKRQETMIIIIISS